MKLIICRLKRLIGLLFNTNPSSARLFANLLIVWLAFFSVISVKAGDTYYLTVGQTQKLSFSTSRVINSAAWYSASPSIVEVTSSGIKSATIKAIKSFSSYVIVRCDYYYLVTSGTYMYLAKGFEDFKIYVNPIDPTNISIQSSLTLDVGNDKVLTPTLTPSNAETTLTWTSDKTSVATVNSSGKVQAKSAGTAIITVKTSNSLSATCKVIVHQPNKVPLANAGSDQSVVEGTKVTLDGSASSDPNSDPLTYKWSSPAGITLSSTTAAKPTFVAPEVSADKAFTFSLVVNDGIVNSTADQVVITIKQENKEPVANGGSDQSVDENSLCTLDGSTSSDPDSDALTYKWTAPEGITLSSKTVAKPTFTAPEVSVDKTYTFSLVVNDGSADSPADQVVITVKQVNKAPVANAGVDQSVNETSLCTLDGSTSSDPDNNTLTYKWNAPSGIALSSTTVAKPTFTAPEVTADKTYTFSLVVNDGQLNSNTGEVTITVKNVDKAPYVKDSIPDISVDKQSPDKIIDLKTIFADDDIDAVFAYSVLSNTNDKVVTATITGTNLVLSFPAGNTGVSEIVIKASSNGKEVRSKFKVQVNIPTGVDPLNDDSSVSIYPNPTKGEVKLKFPDSLASGTRIMVYNNLGKIVYQKLAESKVETINLKGNPAGLYFIQIGNNTKVFKIVLE